MGHLLIVQLVVGGQVGESDGVHRHAGLMAQQDFPATESIIVLVAQDEIPGATRGGVGREEAAHDVAARVALAADGAQIDIVGRVGRQITQAERVAALHSGGIHCWFESMGSPECLPLHAVTLVPHHVDATRRGRCQAQPCGLEARGAVADKGAEFHRLALVTIGVPQIARIDGVEHIVVVVGDGERALVVVVTLRPHQAHRVGGQMHGIHASGATAERDVGHQRVVLVDRQHGVVPSVAVLVLHRDGYAAGRRRVLRPKGHQSKHHGHQHDDSVEGILLFHGYCVFIILVFLLRFCSREGVKR